RGESGSGKTFVAACWAIGIHKYIKSEKPVAWWDTENALSYVLPHFKANGIEVLELKSRRFADSPSFFSEAKKNCDIVVIDNVTHLSWDLVESYLKSKGKKRMRIWDFGTTKPQYRKDLLDNIVNAPLHVIICGRLSDVYEMVKLDGEDILTTTGSRMTGDKSTEYEPSLTVEMQRYTMTDAEILNLAKATKEGLSTYREIKKVNRYRMLIIKDRANILSGAFDFEPKQGETINPDNPVFRAIIPYMNNLNIGGVHKGLDLERDSSDIFGDADKDWQEKKLLRNIMLEKIKTELEVQFGRSQADKKRMKEKLQECFGTYSWTEITERVDYVVLENGYKLLLEGGDANHSGKAANNARINHGTESGEELGRVEGDKSEGTSPDSVILARLEQQYARAAMSSMVKPVRKSSIKEAINEACEVIGYSLKDDPLKILSYKLDQYEEVFKLLRHWSGKK
ncbi:MAG: hypothetical protein ACTSRC_22010, partial [Candidatus Helarchaeota archaeon]